MKKSNDKKQRAKEELTKSREIDRLIAIERRAGFTLTSFKVVVLGGTESLRNEFFRDLLKEQGKNYYREVRQDILKSFKEITENKSIFKEISESQQHHVNIINQTNDITPEIVESIKIIWQELLLENSHDMPHYTHKKLNHYVSELNNYTNSDYNPSLETIHFMYGDLESHGFTEFMFNYDGSKFAFIDIGKQWSNNNKNKWLQMVDFGYIVYPLDLSLIGEMDEYHCQPSYSLAIEDLTKVSTSQTLSESMFIIIFRNIPKFMEKFYSGNLKFSEEFEEYETLPDYVIRGTIADIENYKISSYTSNNNSNSSSNSSNNDNSGNITVIGLLPKPLSEEEKMLSFLAFKICKIFAGKKIYILCSEDRNLVQKIYKCIKDYVVGGALNTQM